METTYQAFTEKLGKLQRNESQMTERQKVQYATQLKALKHQIAAMATEIMHGFLLGGVRLKKEDADECIAAIQKIVGQEETRSQIKKASRVLLQTYDSEKFLEALLPIHQRIWYEAYGPYWCKHCYLPDQEEIERDGWGEYWAYNDIIEAWYHDSEVWIFKDGKSFTLMLPPTNELVRREYKREKQRQAEEAAGKDEKNG